MTQGPFYMVLKFVVLMFAVPQVQDKVVEGQVTGFLCLSEVDEKLTSSHSFNSMICQNVV